MAISEDLHIYRGSTLCGSYKVEAILAEGSFGFVTKCLNMVTKKAEAIKVHKDRAEQAQEDLSILKKLRSLDPDTCGIVRWNGLFYEKGHICLIFELLDQSLRDFMQERVGKTLSLDDLRPILYQSAIALFHLTSLGIIHGDVKPDNIMVVNRHQKPLRVKLIDFGLAHDTPVEEPGVSFGSRYYRAPELILGLPYNEAIDVWSLGVTVAELAIGDHLYTADTNYDVLLFIMQTLGQPEDYILELGSRTNQFFNRQRNGSRQWTLKTPEEYASETGTDVVETKQMILQCLDDLKNIMEFDWGHQNGDERFIDVVKKMLLINSDLRMTPEEVLQHPLFMQTNDAEPEEHERYQTEDKGDLHGSGMTQEGPVELETEGMEIEGESQDLLLNKGSMLGGCHRVEALIGEGGFGFVVQCRNTKTQQVEAIKVSKDKPEDLHEEVSMLTQLMCLDPDTCNIVRWNGLFYEKGHIFLIFETLDLCLLDYFNMSEQTLHLEEIRTILSQSATALFHLGSLGIIHADIKLDNIMIVDRHQKPLRIKLIDFGLAHDAAAAEHGAYFGTAAYRAPEIILDMPYNEAIDMWALGVTIAELAIGDHLYPGETSYDVLHFIMQTQGQPEDYILDRGLRTDQFFKRQPSGSRQWIFKSPEEYASETGIHAEEASEMILQSLDDVRKIMESDWGHQTGQEHFIDLVKRMLLLDSNLRIKPDEVLQHPLLSQMRSPEPAEQPGTSQTEEEPEAPDHQPEGEEPAGSEPAELDPEGSGAPMVDTSTVESADCHDLSILFSQSNGMEPIWAHLENPRRSLIAAEGDLAVYQLGYFKGLFRKIKKLRFFRKMKKPGFFRKIKKAFNCSHK